MVFCAFCHIQFQPRPQVKRPKACQGCQRARQRANEYDWRKRNPKYSDPAYHQIQRALRRKRLMAAAALLAQCVQVGKELLGLCIRVEELSALLSEMLLAIGVRRVNKFLIINSIA